MAERGGIDLGGTKIESVIVNASNRVLGSARRPTPTSGGPRAVATEMARAVREAADQAGIKPAALKGVGVGSPGVVDPDDGSVASARNLNGWDGKFQLGSVLGKQLGTTVRVGNDVQVATDAEFKLGAGREYKSLLGVFWGTGVGGGLILGGKPWLGRGGAGEIGHMVVKQGGARCTCGRRGCLEAYAGRAAMEIRARKRHEKGEKTDLFKIMEERDRTKLTSSVWEHALHHHDKLATKLFDEADRRAGHGDRLGHQPPRRGSGDHRRWPGRQVRAADGRQDRRRDAAPSVPRLRAPGGPRCGARRPRRSHRRGSVGAVT